MNLYGVYEFDARKKQDEVHFAKVEVIELASAEIGVLAGLRKEAGFGGTVFEKEATLMTLRREVTEVWSLAGVKEIREKVEAALKLPLPKTLENAVRASRAAEAEAKAIDTSNFAPF